MDDRDIKAKKISEITGYSADETKDKLIEIHFGYDDTTTHGLKCVDRNITVHMTDFGGCMEFVLSAFSEVTGTNGKKYCVRTQVAAMDLYEISYIYLEEGDWNEVKKIWL